MIFELSQIRSKFPDAYFKRGIDLFKENKVISVEITEEKTQKLKLTTRVQGSGKNIYRQYISFHIMLDKLIGIYGDCTCPVGDNCKHVVAGCLAYQEQAQPKSVKAPEDEDALEFSRWLKTFSKVVKTNLPNKKIDDWFTFSLFNNYGMSQNHSEPSTYEKELDVIKHSYTASGNLAKPKFIKLSTFFSNTGAYGLASSQAKFIAKLLDGCVDNYNYRTGITFENEIGYTVLSELIKRGVAYYKKQDLPLNWSKEAYSLEIDYKKIAKEYSLSLPIPKSCFLVLCEPPILINTDTKQAQMVKSPLSGNSLEQLLKIPKITKTKQLDSLLDLLTEENNVRVKKTPERALPLPVIGDFKVVVINENPQPVLRFHDASQLLLGVVFKYGDLMIPSSDEATTLTKMKVDSVYYEIHHKPKIEQLYLKQIEQYLQPALQREQYDDNNLYSLGDNLSFEESIESFAFLQTEVFPILESENWILDFTENELLDINSAEQVAVQSEPHSNWFELSFNVTLGGETISMLPIMRYLLNAYESTDDLPKKIFVPIHQEKVIEFSKGQVAPIFDTFLQLYGQKNDLPDTVQVQPFDAHLIHGLNNQEIEWKGSKESLKLAQKLKEFTGIKKVKPPKGLQATLREYQQFGLDWLNFLHEFKFNGILADDMGLGKTIQTLTWILKLKETKQLKNPILLIVPTSLIGNWKAESKRFTPDLTLLTLHGSDRFERFDEITKHDIIITTYPLIARDAERLNEQLFTYLILDEAQKIKNPKTKLYQSLQTLKSEHRLCLTGTPIENHLGELWSIFNFLMPGFLSNLPRFKKQYQNPIEKEGKSSIQKVLTQKVSPFLLRRTKKEVVTELPDKTEILKIAEFEPEQANLYETIRLTMESKIRDVVAEKGIGKSQIMILDALLKLRQVCCDPQLVKIDSAKKVKVSAKLELLMDLVTELIEGGHKIILFSQFTSMLAIIEKRFEKAGIKYSLLTGQTKKREETINAFKDGETSVFLISLKTGGVGLNLTEADTVIHYDPWWNPAVENQATDRAYRIGQNKEVFVYKLIMANTIEEKIIKLQVKKQALQDEVYNKENQTSQTTMTGSDLMDLLSE